MTAPRTQRRSGALLALTLTGALLVGFTQDSADAAPARADAAPAREPLGFQAAVVVELTVKDLDRSVAFYRDVLGLELDLRMDELNWAEFRTALPGLAIGLSEEPDAAGSGTVSLNLGVGDTDRARSLLEARGVEFDGETVHIPGVVRLADFRDPDGNRIRLAGPGQ